jgi:hypothetical protein
VTRKAKQKAVTYVGTFEHENMVEHGFTTDAQQRAVIAYADFLETVKKQPGKFGTMIFLVSEGDLLNHHPMTIWSNLDDKDMVALYEDYFAERLRLRAASATETV